MIEREREREREREERRRRKKDDGAECADNHKKVSPSLCVFNNLRE